MNTRRAESFSDGVFAVAITILVFNLLDIGSHGHLTYAVLLGHSWPQYAAYAVGFLTIGIMWLNHHTLLAHAAHVDRLMLVLNILLLMFVVAVPFTTALVADHLDQGGQSAQVAATGYGVLGILLGLAYSALWLYTTTRAGAGGARPIASWLRTQVRFSAGLLGYIAGTLVAAFASADAAVVIYAATGIYYLFEHLPDPTAHDEPELATEDAETPVA